MGSAFYLTWCKKCVNCWGSIESIPLLTTRRLMSWLNGLTLIDMLARRVERNGRDWDTQLPYVLFAYRASLQESPFFLMHGRDPRLQTELLMDQPSTRYQVDLDLATKVKLLPDLKMLGRWPRLMWGKRKNGRRQPMIAKFWHKDKLGYEKFIWPWHCNVCLDCEPIIKSMGSWKTRKNSN